MMENPDLLPFNALSDDEIMTLLSNSSEIDLNDPLYYFDPSCGSDTYTSSTDPDYGSSSEENIYSKYIDYSDLKFPSDDNKNSKIISHNIRSMQKNFEEFQSDIHDFGFDIIALCETWITSETSQLYQNLPGFNPAFLNRDSRGGGVGFYVKNEIL